MRGWMRLVGVGSMAACLGACGGGSGNDGPNVPSPTTSISLTVSSVSVSGTRMHATPTAQFFVTVLHISQDLFLDVDHSTNGLEGVAISFTSNVQARVDIAFRSPDELAVDTHADTITVKVCYDPQCNRHVGGSPAKVPVSYAVAGRLLPPEPGLPVLPTLSRVELAHDVVSAGYSNALDAIVMVSSHPENALFVLDPDSGVRHAVSLSKTPAALALASDGLAAAVGHDALVSYVNLAELVQTGATSPIELDLSSSAFDLVLDDRGFVHVFPEPSGSHHVHSIEIATNIETLGGFSFLSKRSRLHPSGDAIYATGEFSGGLDKYDISSGTAAFLYQAPHLGDHRVCGNLWISEDGQTIYNGCGQAFQASAVQSEDMVYTGSLELSDAESGFRIAHLSRFDPMNEIMLVEFPVYSCSDPTHGEQSCWTHLATFESESLTRTALFSIPTVNIDGSDFKQRGLFAFHSADGTRRYLIGSAPWAPASPYYLSVLQ